MNAKKIMGAVLVALLAAALFVGAGAAANGETVFVYQIVPEATYNGTWVNSAGNTVSFVQFDANDATNVAIIGAGIAEGEYKKGDESIIVKYPTATILGSADYDGIFYGVIGGTYYKVAGSELNIDVAGDVATGIVIIGEDNIPTIYNDEELDEGTYKLQAYFNVDGVNFVSTAPTNFANVLLGKDVFTITVVEGADPTVTAVADTVIVSNTVEVVITGLPGVTYIIDAPGFTIPAQAAGNNIEDDGVVMPNTGKVTVTLKAGTTTGEKTIKVAPEDEDLGDEAELDIEIVAGAITAAADQEAYYIGNTVTITGTSTAGATVYFYIAGTNKEFSELDDAPVKKNAFELEIDGDKFENFDAGTYTVYVAADEGADAVKELNTYATVALVLKQPFISVTDAPSVAVKGSTYKVTGTAEAAKNVYAYIFGTNFFAAASSDSADEFVGPAFLDDKFTVNVKKNEFTINVEIPEETANMSAGQYFMVVQHPMYDEQFNVAPFEVDGGAIITMNSTTAASETSPVVVDVFGRQKANAAQALCENLDSENIDDMYVKLSFVVGAPTSVINPIPSEIVKGEKLTVSGTTNVGEGEIVTVEMLSTAFAAVPKSTVGSASFISLVTKTDENGNWEVTFDTTGLNVDEYTVTAAVEQLGSSATAKVNVVEKAPVTPEQPDTPVTPEQPEQPEQPTEPETPGFGALAALAGLGAVAVLLLRRE